MRWYYVVMGGHTHVRVFMNGAKCGDLCFRNEEFRLLAGEDPKGDGEFGCVTISSGRPAWSI